MAMRWEYEVMKAGTGGFFSLGSADPVELKSLLNAKGSDGWELVNAVDTATPWLTREIVLVFKRPRDR